MKLNAFRAKKVHGYLEFNIKFYSDLTFLIGINGSGKTSALKLILGLISPSFYYLTRIEYESAELVCSSVEDEEDIIIRVQRVPEANMFVLYLKYGGVEYRSEEIPRFIKKPDFESRTEIEEFSVIEQGYKERFDNLEITHTIRNLATPKFLGLDRRIYEGKAIDQKILNKRRFLYPNIKRRFIDENNKTLAIDDSLEEVQYLIYDYFRKIANQQPRISEEFKQKIFQSTFDFADDLTVVSMPENTDEVLAKKERVSAAIENLGLNYLRYNVNTFFNKMQGVISQYIEFKRRKSEERISDEELRILRKWFNNNSQLRRIDDIIRFSQIYQDKIEELRFPLRKLEEIASNFLKESKKSLVVTENGDLRVMLKNGKVADVFELSSGEKQIIIMIAHLIFEEDQKPSGVFIIDEPELSLHLAWQEIFVDSIIAASPKTQFILATHSPSIIAKVDKEKHCQDLNKLNF